MTKLELHEEILQSVIPRSADHYFLAAFAASDSFFKNVLSYRFNPSQNEADIAHEIAEVLIAMTHLAQHIGVARVNSEIERVIAPAKKALEKNK